MGFVLKKVKHDIAPTALRRLADGSNAYDSNWLTKSFDICGWYIVFHASKKETYIYPISLRATIYSAFVTALRSIENLELPILFAYGNASDIHSLEEIIGFSKTSGKKVSALFPIPGNSVRHFRYESIITKKLNSKHFLYFFDGLRKIYESKLTEIYNNYSIESFLKENSHVICKDIYLYTLDDFSWLLANQNQTETSQGSSENGWFSSAISSILSKFVNRSKAVGISSILVEIQYREQKQVSVIDNVNYTTLIPSKQLPGSWRTVFNFEKRILGGKKEDPIVNSFEANENLDGFVWMANCIRSLLILLIYSQTSKGGCISAASFDHQRARLGNILDLAALNSVSEVLSTATKQFINTADTISTASAHGAVENGRRSPASPISPTNSRAESEDSFVVLNSIKRGESSVESHTSDFTSPNGSFEALQLFFCNSKVNQKPAYIFQQGSPPAGFSGSGVSDSRGVMGNWMGLLALLCGCLPEGVREITNYWFEAVHNCQECWDDKLFLRPVLWDDSEGHDSLQNESSLPIYQRLLWNDALTRMRQQGVSVCIPDCSESIIVQKLQMIHFCTVMKREYPFFTPLDAQEENGVAPELCRRLPLTEDKVAMHEHIARKISNADSRRADNQSQSNYPQLRWQMQIPSLVSDMRAFKAANLSGSFDSFCQWYGLEPTSEMLPALQSLWDSSEAIPCRDQKPLFHAEKEFEKSIAYLEGLTLTALSCELLSSSIRFIIQALHARISKLLNRLRSSLGQQTNGSKRFPDEVGILADMQVLQENAVSVSERLKSLSNQKIGEVADLEDFRSLVIVIDSIAGLVERVEEYAIRIDAVESVFLHFADAAASSSAARAIYGPSLASTETQMEVMERLVLSLGRADSSSYELQSGEEVSVIMAMIKSMAWHEGEGRTPADRTESGKAGPWKHAWHSYDGRELGLPAAKSFSVRLASDTESFSSIDAAAAAEVVAGYHPYGTASSDMFMNFRMDADITGHNELRVSFVIPEDAD